MAVRLPDDGRSRAPEQAHWIAQVGELAETLRVNEHDKLRPTRANHRAGRAGCRR